MMQATRTSPSEEILRDLTHDLRQSLGTIGVSAYLLDQSLPDASQKVRELIATIERQVDFASSVLKDAAAAMRRQQS